MKCPTCRQRDLPTGATVCDDCAAAVPQPVTGEPRMTGRVVRDRKRTLPGFGFALLFLAGCTIRGGACTTDEACAPEERCDAGRCAPLPAPTPVNPPPDEPPPVPKCVPAPGGGGL